jgi:CD109 antigen
LQIDNDILPGSFVLEVQSLSGSANAFYDKKFLYVESTTFSIFIQSNKAIYKPGGQIKYRIMILDAETKPINVDKNLKISIFDATKNKIHQLTGQSTQNGVYLGEFQTSLFDRLGLWEIEAEYKEKVIALNECPTNLNKILLRIIEASLLHIYQLSNESQVKFHSNCI